MLHQLINFLLSSLTGEQDAEVLEILHLGHELILLWLQTKLNITIS